MTDRTLYIDQTIIASRAYVDSKLWGNAATDLESRALKAASGGQLTLYDWGMINDGVTDNTAAMTICLNEAFNNNYEVYVPPGDGFVLAHLATFSFSGEAFRMASFYGAGYGKSRIIVTSDEGGIKIEKTSAQGEFYFNFRDIDFFAMCPNAGCALWLRHYPVPGSKNYTEVQIDRVSFRAGNPPDNSALWYWGDYAWKVEGFSAPVLRDLDKDRCTTPLSWAAGLHYLVGDFVLNKPTAAEVTAWLVTAPSYAKYFLVSNGGKLYECTTTHTPAAATEPGVGANWPTRWRLKGTADCYRCLVDHTASAAGTAGDEPGVGASWLTNWVSLGDDPHDAWYAYAGIGGGLIWNCYGPSTKKLAGVGGRYGVVNGGDRLQSPEGGVFDEFLTDSTQIGLRSSAWDYQPGFTVRGNHVNCRDKGIYLGGPIITGMAVAGGTTPATLTLGPELNAKLWLTGTSYPITTLIVNGGKLYECWKLHTSAATSEPGVGATWTSFWVVRIDSASTLWIVGGPGFGQHRALHTTTPVSTTGTTTVAGPVKVEIIETGPTSAWNGPTRTGYPSAKSRYVIEDNTNLGGRGNVIINGVYAFCMRDGDRSDGAHGDLNPVVFDLINAVGVVLHDNQFTGGGTWLDDHTRMIGVGVSTKENLITGNAFFGNCESVIYNPEVDTVISGLDDNLWVMGTGRPLYQGDFYNGRYFGARASNHHTGGVAATIAAAGAEVIASQALVYFCQVYISEAQKIAGVSILNSGTVAGGLKVALYDTLGNLLVNSDMASPPVQGPISVYQRVPFLASYGAVRGTYFVALKANTGRFRAHTFGDFTAFTVATTDINTPFPATVTPPATFTANVGPIASLY